MEESVIRIKVLRYIPESREERVDLFEVPYRPGMTVQVLLRHIYESIDPTLSFRDYRCGQGICNTCRIRVNGKVKKSCETQVQVGEELFLEPANDRVLKDLIVQFS